MAKNLIDYLDLGLVGTANGIVKGWNWFSGDTKAQLANKLMALAPVLESYEDYQRGKLGWIPFNIGTAAFVMFLNPGMEKDENKATESGIVDGVVSSYKNWSKLLSLGCLSMGAVYFISPSLPLDEERKTFSGGYLNGLGYLSRGLSHLVMCADAVPPKKSVFRRGYEKGKEMLQEYQRRQAEPALARVSSSVRFCE